MPIMGDIVSFFLRNLQPGSDADHPFLPAGAGPRAAMTLIANLPKDAFQVTPTGQVATSYPGCATVYTLNKKTHRTPRSCCIVHSLRLTNSAR